ncbi:dihydroorotase [Rhodohalobacter halophilus]|uniref:dihydroorotase n=1 Tax=Rhodohalobacter halophilus TaxID=1812810 RepID=UPI00083F8FEE|nr:dihydroorotase [Rhodohalobacter halophilus]
MEAKPNILIKNCIPVGDNFDGKSSMDIRISDGKISELGKELSSNKDEQEYDAGGAFVSGGWMDMHVHFREPGFEHKETVETGCRSAMFGGFTEVACMPNTKPATHTRDVVEFIKKKAEGQLVDVHPIGTVTKERRGESIAEMADMQKGGAVAFSDDGDPVYDSQVMRVALEYSSMLGVPIINHEEDLALSRPGHMNEGVVSTRLGLEGTPGIAEETMIARDILLAGFTGGHIHVAHISTRKAVDLVRKAKAEGINVTTEVCTHHFDLTDEEIDKRHFDTNVKMHPPLRTQDDVDAMIEGLADGTIDVICTDHAPHAIEEKEVEFIYAPNGITGLDTAWSISVMRLIKPGKLSLNQVMDKLVVKPREILNLYVPKIEAGENANLTLFNTDEEWTYSEKEVRSKSKNSPYIGDTLTGRAIAVYNRGRFHENLLKDKAE